VNHDVIIVYRSVLMDYAIFIVQLTSCKEHSTRSTFLVCFLNDQVFECGAAGNVRLVDGDEGT